MNDHQGDNNDDYEDDRTSRSLEMTMGASSSSSALQFNDSSASLVVGEHGILERHQSSKAAKGKKKKDKKKKDKSKKRKMIHHPLHAVAGEGGQQDGVLCTSSIFENVEISFTATTTSAIAAGESSTSSLLGASAASLAMDASAASLAMDAAVPEVKRLKDGDNDDDYKNVIAVFDVRDFTGRVFIRRRAAAAAPHHHEDDDDGSGAVVVALSSDDDTTNDDSNRIIAAPAMERREVQLAQQRESSSRVEATAGAVVVTDNALLPIAEAEGQAEFQEGVLVHEDKNEEDNGAPSIVELQPTAVVVAREESTGKAEVRGGEDDDAGVAVEREERSGAELGDAITATASATIRQESSLSPSSHRGHNSTPPATAMRHQGREDVSGESISSKASRVHFSDNSNNIVTENMKKDDAMHLRDDDSAAASDGVETFNDEPASVVVAAVVPHAIRRRRHRPSMHQQQRRSLAAAAAHSMPQEAAQKATSIGDGINKAAASEMGQSISTAASTDSSSTTSANKKAPATSTTRLHELCARPNVKLKELQAALEEEPEAASVPDANGCLPLHVLGNNDVLIDTVSGRRVASKFCWQLMLECPEAITTPDNHGYMPFVQQIEEWMYWVYEEHRQSHHNETWSTENSSGSWSRGKGVAVSAFKSIVNAAVTVSSGSNSRSASCKETLTLDCTSESLVRYSMATFPTVQLFKEAEWCFQMLSCAMCGLGGKEGSGGTVGDGGGMAEGGGGGAEADEVHEDRRRIFNGANKRARAELATHLVTKLPTLLKTVLLIQDDGNDNRRKLLQKEIFRRALLCPECVGPWLISMLRRKGIPSQRAVDFLRIVSGTCPEDYVGGFANVLPRDIKEFKEARLAVFKRISQLNGPVVSLLVLDDEEQERAVAACVIWYSMKERLTRPFVVSLTLVDFVLHVTILLAYRTLLSIVHLTERGQQELRHWSFIVIYLTCANHFIRKFCECASIFAISKRVFVSYMLNWWTILDVVTTALTLTAVVLWDNSGLYNVGFHTFVLGLLWIKVLSFLKVVNQSMATFILSLIRIVRGARHFGLVMVVFILMFGDMFHYSLLTKDDGHFCTDIRNDTMSSEAAKSFCDPIVEHSYLRVYTLLLGDFALEDYQETSGMLALWLIFTILGIIVMLNLLIAVMSSSYEQARARSLLLFGRARITFVAQTYALENFLRPRSPCRRVNRRWCFLDVTTRFVRHFLLIALVGTSTFTESYVYWRIYLAVQEGRYILLLVVATMFAMLMFSNCVILVYALEFWFRGVAPGAVVSISKYLSKGSDWINQGAAAWLFGLDPRETFRGGISDSEERGLIVAREHR